MGERIRNHPWAESPLGPPETWPQSLRSALSICLHSTVPTAIYWGPELRLVYNDAWAPIPAERHPWTLGRPAREVWADIWAVIEPQFTAVLADGEGFSTFDQMLPMVRGGEARETYWNYSFSPIRGESGAVAGIFNQGHETTERILHERSRDEAAARQRRLFQQAPGFITILAGPEHVFEFVNDAYRRLFGARDYLGKTVRQAFPELAGQGFYEWLDQAYATGERFVAKRVPARLDFPGASSEACFLDFIYEPVTDDQGRVTGIFCEGFDVSAAHKAEQALVEQRPALEALNRIAATTAIETDRPHRPDRDRRRRRADRRGLRRIFLQCRRSDGESYMLYTPFGSVPRGAFARSSDATQHRRLRPTFAARVSSAPTISSRPPLWARRLRSKACRKAICRSPAISPSRSSRATAR